MHLNDISKDAAGMCRKLVSQKNCAPPPRKGMGAEGECVRRPHSSGRSMLLMDGSASAETLRSGSDSSEDRPEPVRRSCSAAAAPMLLALLRSRLATSSMISCASSPARRQLYAWCMWKAVGPPKPH